MARAQRGGDTGPNPHDLLLAALGACKSMTLRIYADRKGWPLAGVEVLPHHERMHAGGSCAGRRTGAGSERADDVGARRRRTARRRPAVSGGV